ncbi:FKBP-type peptidyl-prolyl cis-trans isomerase [Sangeribacter muris]|jgi:ectoine hydroxylase-related dioxygenase (phytanoyl-CoA dioxygenase family)|uniref:FKBP-type peptidyl-prolyl cis-trans isomerase n=1 Tax=Sangeribacter muris TaxID=2880703 RepID=UPI00244DCAE4|nr:FKBP-type peptidyl-prolyl cis-trans isomerase [Sangeribacter muris]
MKKSLYFLPLIAMVFTGCLSEDEEPDYVEWKKQNEEYVTKMEELTENGEKVYTKVVPEWAPNDFVLIKWHNDRSLTEKNLKPLSNSTVNIKYEMEDINGKYLGDSYSMTQYGDSIYQSMPNENIIGMWVAMTSLHVGDSVTLVIPAGSAYGSASRSPIEPFSTLIYHMKMKGVPKYEK